MELHRSRHGAAPVRWSGPFGALRSRNFATLWFGNLLSNIGSWMQQVAEPWLVLHLSNSPFLVGVDAFAEGAPVWILILLGGLIADRRDRRAVIGLFQGIQAACPVLLVILLWLNRLQVWEIIALSAVVGITDALSMPAIQALVPSTVPEERIASAVALNSAQFNLSRVLGPLAAGSVMAAFGPIACFGVNAFSYVPFLAAIALISLPAVAVAPSGEGRRSLGEALKLVRTTPALRTALLTVAFNGLLGSSLVIFAPVLVRDVYHRESAAFGGSLSVFGLGGLLGAGLVLFVTETRARQRLSAIAALAVGALMLGIAFSPSFGVFVALFCMVGTATVATNAASNSVLQSTVGSELRGRIGSLYALALRGMVAIGSILTGLVIDHAGVRVGLIINGIGALVAQGVVSWVGREPGHPKSPVS